MRIKHLPWIISSLAIILFSGYTIMYPTGAPAAKTGSPGDGANCTECHGGTATTTAGQITSNIPASGYVPGTTYQITATNPLTNTGKMGFEVSPQNVAGNLLGTLVAGTGSQLVGSGKYVTHIQANTTTNTWTFGWIAPAAGTGTVTFYGAFARDKPGPVTKSTLVVQEAVAAPGAAGPITGPATVCKNNTETYSVGTIAGATSYVWTAPSGATITSGQGTVSISVLFGASATSGNVSVHGANSSGSGTASNLLVSVSTVPSAPATPDGPALVNLQNTLTSDYTTSTGADSYIWELSPAEAGTISGSTETAQVSWNTAFNGNAEISVRGVNSCGESIISPVFTTQVINTTGISDDKVAINAFQSTLSGYLTLVMNTNVSQGRLMMMDLSGRILLNTTIAGQGTQQISHQLKAGVYVVVVEAGKARLNKKILVM
jgi:hypothetical protein